MSGPFFIVSAPRSGSTLLRNLLRQHPGLECPEETSFFRWSEPFGTRAYERIYRNNPVIKSHREMDGISEEEFFEIYSRSSSRKELQVNYANAFLEKKNQGDAIWFDKTPQNTQGIVRLKHSFPDSKIVHITRHPLNVVSSIMQGRSVGPETLVGALNIWMEAVSAVNIIKMCGEKTVVDVRYEDLIAIPKETITYLLAELEIPQSKRISFKAVELPYSRYLEQLSEEQIDQVLETCKGPLIDLGYPADRESLAEWNYLQPARRPRSVQKEKPLLPTTSLYLTDALFHRYGLDLKSHRFADHGYLFSEKAVFVRYATVEDTRKLDKPFLYVVDDHLEAIADDRNLPVDYRKRIRAFLREDYPRLIDEAEEIVVSSDSVHAQYESLSKPVTCLEPYWRELDQAPVPNAADSRFRVAWLASRAHLTDLESISEELLAFFEKYPRATFTVVIGKHINESLSRIPRLKNLKPMSWTGYRSWLARQRFDVVIHPLLDTPVNRARSFSKWQEIAVTGAVPLISNIPPWRDLVNPQCTDCLVESGQWQQALTQLVEEPELRAGLAEDARQIADRINRKAAEAQVSFWRDRLHPLL